MSIVELPDDEAEASPKTIAFNAEQTVQFLGGSSAIDDSSLTSHWEGSDRRDVRPTQRHDQAEGNDQRLVRH